MLEILAINVSYVNAADKNPSKLVFTDVYNEDTFPNDQIIEGKSLFVLFHCMHFSGFQ